VASIAAVLVAAGRSRRMGSDKLWIDLWGRAVWRWSLDDLLALDAVEDVAVVVPPNAADRFAAALPERARARCRIVPGGEQRADSVLAGADALAEAGCAAETLVLVHDAARPAAGRDLIERVLAAAGDEGGVVPVVPVADTLLRTSSLETIDRRDLVATQTPQLARLGDLRRAVRAGGGHTDEASALLADGITVRTVPGDASNRKLTEPVDEAQLRATLRDRALAGLGAPGMSSQRARVGIGFDAHRLEPGRRMRLAGVDFPDEPIGLVGHSDGDVALHAVADGLLGATALGDLGALFPSDDPAWKDADSKDLLRDAAHRARDAGWRPANVDLVIVARRPSIAPRRDEMRDVIATALAIDTDRVSVKGTTSDGLGFAGDEGIAAYAVVTVEPR
jgi:2-C-methyl-D-erythritol 4-phosphate cytidylyltransferase/2-C-methyl-D-erythritol 2,4-cyclodiphosphate synthase